MLPIAAALLPVKPRHPGSVAMHMQHNVSIRGVTGGSPLCAERRGSPLRAGLAIQTNVSPAGFLPCPRVNRGHYGFVFQATNKVTGKSVAIKRVDRSLCTPYRIQEEVRHPPRAVS